MATTGTTIARTPDEIVARIKGLGSDDLFGWSTELLLGYLPYGHVKPWLKEGVTEEEWEARTDPRADLIDYLDFAWKKANDERGISAGRSVDKIGHWLWLIGEDELLREFEAAAYPDYGKPKLRVVTRALRPELLEEVDGRG